jgi:hypothetical protein
MKQRLADLAGRVTSRAALIPFSSGGMMSIPAVPNSVLRYMHSFDLGWSRRLAMAD